MFIAPKNTDLLLVEAVGESLYLKLVAQIKAKFNLANGNRFSYERHTRGLKIFTRKIFRLIQYKFAEYLNLLYIIDVSEESKKT
jgi:hypothetical protein